jgi:hypothetical protein
MFFSDLPSFPHCGTAQENFFQKVFGSPWIHPLSLLAKKNFISTIDVTLLLTRARRKRLKEKCRHRHPDRDNVRFFLLAKLLSECSSLSCVLGLLFLETLPRLHCDEHFVDREQVLFVFNIVNDQCRSSSLLVDLAKTSRRTRRLLEQPNHNSSSIASSLIVRTLSSFVHSLTLSSPNDSSSLQIFVVDVKTCLSQHDLDQRCVDSVVSSLQCTTEQDYHLIGRGIVLLSLNQSFCRDGRTFLL